MKNVTEPYQVGMILVQELSAMTGCRSFLQGDVISWGSAKWTLNGSQESDFYVFFV